LILFGGRFQIRIGNDKIPNDADQLDGNGGKRSVFFIL